MDARFLHQQGVGVGMYVSFQSHLSPSELVRPVLVLAVLSYLAWIVPRLLRARQIFKLATAVGGPNGDQVLVQLRNDKTRSSWPYVPMAGRTTHLVADPVLIQRALASPLLLQHDVFQIVEGQMFGASNEWDGRRDGFIATLDTLLHSLRAGGTTLLTENFGRFAEAELQSLLKHVKAAGVFEAKYSDTLERAFAYATAQSFIGPYRRRP